MRHDAVDRPIREPPLALPIFDINLFSQPILKGAREARSPGRNLIAACLFLDVGEEESQVTALGGLRTGRRRHFKLEVLFDPPGEGTGEVETQGDEFRAGALFRPGGGGQRLQTLS